MTPRPPRPLLWSGPARSKDESLLRLDDELAQEKASALGRMGRALEAALAKLAAFDAGGPAAVRENRPALVNAAYRALWEYIVQREACGLRDARTIMRDYNVPPDVQRLFGVSHR